MQKIQIPYSPADYFAISSFKDFEKLALDAYAYQYHTNVIYRSFCNHMGINHPVLKTITDIPFLPIELFKQHKIICGDGLEQKIFKSSGTTGSIQSKHYVLHEDIYRLTLLEGFKRAFGDPSKYSFLALLPGYVERPDSSLVYMVNELMQKSTMKHNHFYKEVNQDLLDVILYNQQNEIDTLLFGVSFSLLQFSEKNPIPLKNITLVETGGMKGQAEEKTRKELHTILKDRFKIKEVYSEYGMTELLSQAYCTKDEQFELPVWMQILIREANDPKTFVDENKVGGINIIDLANIHSCCFISTQDLGKKTSPNTFEVLGRFDNADIRGCNLLFL